MNTTLDEWDVLHTVVQLGGFARAAEQLRRSQSTVSYTIARLQERLGIRMLELKGRKAQLTEAGRVLLADAEPHLAGFHQLEQRARSLARGGESEIRLSVDSIFPHDRLFSALAALTRRFPYVRMRLRQGTFLSADSEFSMHKSDLCVTGLPSGEFFVKPILEIGLVAVARRDHPLHSLKRRPSRADFLQHTLVIIEGVTAGSSRHQPRGPAQRFLGVSTIEAAIDAVRSGLCFGWLPRYRIQPLLDDGELVELRMPIGQTRGVRLSVVCRDLGSASHELNVLADLLGAGGEMEAI